MSDHADTIRRTMEKAASIDNYTLLVANFRKGFAALDALVAERQQAIDALSEGLTICEDANRPWQRLDVAAVLRSSLVSLGEKP